MFTRKIFLKKVKCFIKNTFFTFTVFPLLAEYLEAAEDKSAFDLVALKGGKGPDELFRKGITYLGGMGRFVKKGQSVLIKPNIGWDRTPEYGANTDHSGPNSLTILPIVSSIVLIQFLRISFASS